uniref:Putative abc transporter n=1 Tax=Rhipicephalus microplus TaxID=6941 RepID=A0A6M2D2C4_RHIMP
MGYCPQRDGLLDMLTGVETVLLFGRLRGIPITNDYLSALLNIFRLQEIADYLVGTYSAGNRRKLSMCISMIGLPRIVLLDEPYAAISTTARRQIVNYVSALQKVSKMSILLSSHRRPLLSPTTGGAKSTCPEVLVMRSLGAAFYFTLQ